MPRRAKPRDDFDGPWKEILVRLFPQFIAFCAPDLYAAIDWSQPVEFQPQELKKILPSSRSRKGIVDILARVRLRTGDDLPVFCHAEAQAFKKDDFSERMFRTHIRLYEKTRGRIFSLALLLDRSPNWRPVHFQNQLLGTGCDFRFRTVKILDYRDRMDELRASPNPFAVTVLIHLHVLLARTVENRLQSKRALARELLTSGLKRQPALDLFRFLDWIIRLPDDLQDLFETEMDAMKAEKDEIYLTKWEREGLQKGIEQERERGRREDVVRVLEVRFGPLPDRVRETLSGITDPEHLARLIDAAALATGLSDFEKALGDRREG